MPAPSKNIQDLIDKNPELQAYIDELIKNKSSKGTLPKSTDRSNIEYEDAVDPKKFNLYQEIKNNPLYKISNRDRKARATIDEYRDSQKKRISSKTKIVPGQLVLFKYLNPKTKEELDYYDSSPLTLFFGVFNSQEGKRVLGFNVHYFPPQIRYRIMDKIYQMYRPVYKKYFETGVPHELDGFDYRFLVDELERHNLSFTVRMYIPSLIGDTYVVPPKMWPTALMTEGWFKKETRATIMQYFKGDAKAKRKISTGAHSKGKAEKKGKK